MKFLLALVLSAMSLTVLANENYECDFVGPNYDLVIKEDGAITLSNYLNSYQCSKGYVNLPGTEAELSVLNCGSGNGSVMFYANENADGDIVLSKGLVFSKNILCKKKN